MPSNKALLKFLDAEQKSIKQEIQLNKEAYYCMKLRFASAKSMLVEFKTTRTKMKSNIKKFAAKQSPRGPRRQNINEETESEDELDDDFNIVSKRLMMEGTETQIPT